MTSWTLRGRVKFREVPWQTRKAPLIKRGYPLTPWTLRGGEVPLKLVLGRSAHASAKILVC